jgi:hypothetical protein
METDNEVEVFETPWSFWDSIGLICAGYASDSDLDLILVFIETSKEKHWYVDIANRLNLNEKYVVLLMEILCSADYCMYGSSPRGAWADPDTYNQNLEKLIQWYINTWGVNEDITSLKELIK